MFIVAGVAMVFGARVPVFVSGLIGGLWLIFIGWFLNGAALQSYRQVVVQDLLAGVPMARLARTNVPTVAPATPVDALVHDYILATDERALSVVQSDRLVGLVCLEDMRKIPRETWMNTTAGQIMTPAS